MRTPTLFAVAVLSIASAFAAPTVTLTRDDVLKTLDHAREIADASDAKAEKATADLAGANEKLVTATADREKADAKLVQAAKDIETQGKLLDTANSKLLTLQAAYDKVNAEYQRLEFWGALLFALVAFLLVWKWSPSITSPYAMALYFIAPAAAFGFFYVIF